MPQQIQPTQAIEVQPQAQVQFNFSSHQSLPFTFAAPRELDLGPTQAPPLKAFHHYLSK